MPSESDRMAIVVCCCGCVSVTLSQELLETHGSGTVSRQSRSWPQHWWTLLGWSYLTLVWYAGRDCEGLEMLPEGAFFLSDQCHFLYRNAHENPSSLCFVLGYQTGHCLHLYLWCMCLCLWCICVCKCAYTCIRNLIMKANSFHIGSWFFVCFIYLFVYFW